MLTYSYWNEKEKNRIKHCKDTMVSGQDNPYRRTRKRRFMVWTGLGHTNKDKQMIH